jgi:hypothetical protein
MNNASFFRIYPEDEGSMYLRNVIYKKQTSMAELASIMNYREILENVSSQTAIL